MVRYKNRYIVAEINPNHAPAKFQEYKIVEYTLYNTIRNKVQQLYGDFGLASVQNGLIVKYWNSHLRTVLIRVRHGPHKFVTSALPFVDRISDKRVSLNILYVGATMRNCFKFLVKFQKDKAVKDLIVLKGTDEYKRLYDAYTHVKFTEELIF